MSRNPEEAEQARAELAELIRENPAWQVRQGHGSGGRVLVAESAEAKLFGRHTIELLALLRQRLARPNDHTHQRRSNRVH